jgi:nitroreductase
MDVLTAIRSRRSVRSYADRPIPPEVLQRLRTALRIAPSACNFQPWHFVFVHDAELRRKLAQACNDQLWIAAAPLTVVACGLPERAYKHMGSSGNSADIDVAIALTQLTLAAAADGLGTCWIGAFDERRIKPVLAVPTHAKVVALMPVGYPASPDLLTECEEGSRRPEAQIFALDRYGGA